MAIVTLRQLDKLLIAYLLHIYYLWVWCIRVASQVPVLRSVFLSVLIELHVQLFSLFGVLC